MSEMQSPPENEFDTEVFIQEIQNRPVLWDISKREYSDRVLKRKAWEEICILFIPQFETKTTDEKNAEAVNIQKKWKSIRDRYTRKKKSVTKSGSGASTSREYLYSKFLTFLNPLSRIRPPKSPSKSSSDKQSQKINKPNKSSEEKLLEILCERMHDKCQDKNYVDQQFLMSLVEDFSAIHSEYKMDAKMEIMGIIKKYTQMSKYTRLSPNQQGYFTSSDSPSMSSSSYQAPPTDQDETSQESLYGNLYSGDADVYLNL